MAAESTARVMPDRLALLPSIHLAKGAHEATGAEIPKACVMEIASWLAGEPWSDSTTCVSTVLGGFARSLNDALPDDTRQQLAPLAPRLIGTADDGLDETRGYMALDWLIRTYTPAWLDLANLSEEAAALRSLRRIVDLAAAKAAGPVVRVGRENAAAAWDAAGDAAWDAAGAAAWDAARDAARDAAWDAAWAAAGAAAWDAARAAAGDAARAAAGAAARDAAGDAAGTAARAALKPTITQLQQSAIDLFDRMVTGRWDDGPHR